MSIFSAPSGYTINPGVAGVAVAGVAGVREEVGVVDSRLTGVVSFRLTGVVVDGLADIGVFILVSQGRLVRRTLVSSGLVVVGV